MTSTKAIIFDCFGVLTVSTYNAFYAAYFENQPEKIEQARHLDHASNQGNITFDDFIAGLAELASISIDETRAFISRHQPNTELLEYIRDVLKPHYKIGFLSNVADNLVDKVLTKEEQLLFDDFVLSYEVKLAKPDAGIFELAAKRLNVATEECIFVDDVASYCEAARMVKMSAIEYQDFDSFKREIEKLLRLT